MSEYERIIAVAIEEYEGNECLLITYEGINLYCSLFCLSPSEAFKRIYPLIKIDALVTAETNIRYVITNGNSLLRTDEFRETLRRYDLVHYETL